MSDQRPALAVALEYLQDAIDLLDSMGGTLYSPEAHAFLQVWNKPTDDDAWIHYDGEPSFLAEACPTCGSLPAPTCGVCTNLAYPHGECPEHGA